MVAGQAGGAPHIRSELQEEVLELRRASDLALLATKKASCSVGHSIAALVDKDSSNRVDKFRSYISLS